jgi:hypothetical protein
LKRHAINSIKRGHDDAQHSGHTLSVTITDSAGETRPATTSFVVFNGW